MKKTILFDFNVINEKNKIEVKRSFNAPIDLVWATWTEADLLDQWWAPKPYVASTKSLDFREGGRWHYYMKGPTGDIHWCLFDYEKIIPFKYFSGIDAFCDEHGKMNDLKPRVKWSSSFDDKLAETHVLIELNFNSLEDLEAIIQMGFKEGFTMGLENLDQYIASQFYLRKKNKSDNSERICTYVNFPGNTEEAFLFYQSIFKNDFINGIQRFGDLPANAEQPPISNDLKKMILHIELPLLGNHILMGTDAPKEMGFEVKQGNNMHIQIEPKSKQEADRIFKELSKDGNITMPLQDMFWGAYFGSCVDKFGINWMVNYQLK